MFGKSIFRSYSSLINLIARITDPLLVVLSAIAAYAIEFQSMDWLMPSEYRVSILIAFFCTLIIFPFFGIYASWRGQGLFRQARMILLAWVMVIVATVILLFIFKVSEGYSRSWLAIWSVLGLLFILSTRVLVYLFLQNLRKKGVNLRYVVIVGAGELGERVLAQIGDALWTGYKVIGLFDDNPKLLGKSVRGVKVLGDLDEISAFVSHHQIDEVWVALPLRAEQRMRDLLFALRNETVNVKLLPDIFGFTLLYHSMTEVAGLPAVNLSVSPMDGGNRLVKAIEDRLLALLMLIVLSPLMLMIALLVKLSSKGPVFFRQKRLSWNGKEFDILKFRTMNVSEDGRDNIWGNAYKKEMTALGRFLRKTSLDELPQLFNVLKGEMSIVGPRPEIPEFVEKFKEEVPGYMQKHMVKAGITGWAQVHGWRGDTCLKTRIEHDLYYIENWSLWFDMKIILMTVLNAHKNAR